MNRRFAALMLLAAVGGHDLFVTREERPNRVLIVMRGLPCSGKSTEAEEVVSGPLHNVEQSGLRFKLGQNGVICSADYYYDSGWGTGREKYEFDPEKLMESHEKCFLAVRSSFLRGVPVVVLDNTNVKIADFERYIELAIRSKYRVLIVEVPTPVDTCVRRNNGHNVPESTIRNMAAKWEGFTYNG